MPVYFNEIHRRKIIRDGEESAPHWTAFGDWEIRALETDSKESLAIFASVA